MQFDLASDPSRIDIWTMTMECRFAKKIESLNAIFDCITQFADAHGIDASISRDMQFGVEEIFTNMVKYNPESSNDVLIGLSVDHAKLSIAVTDYDVHSHDPMKVPPVDVNQPIHERTPGGLGIHLVRAMMDDVQYDYHDRTVTITLIKNLEK